MSIDQRQLADLTDEVDQLHHEGMRTFREKAEAEIRTSRRSLFAKAGAGGALLSLGAMAGPISRLVPAASAAGLDDGTLAAFGASLEFAIAAAYQSALDSGKLSASVANTARMFQGHHLEHGRAFNAISSATSEKPNTRILAVFKPRLRVAAGEDAILQIAFSIEETAAATYLSSLGVLQDQSNAELVATILPVESQHAVVIGQILKKPVSDYMPAFQSGDQALDASRYPV